MTHIPFDGAQDKVFRTLGPPGCGKTTWLVRQAERAIEKFGVDGVRVVSMTRAAEREFKKRDSPVPRENISTLHSLAYQAIGKPRVVRSKDVAQFGVECGYEMSGALEDGGLVDRRELLHGDALLLSADLHRARMTESLNPDVAEFAKRWRDWKRAANMIDFTDMLELALETTTFAPGRPSAFLIDEGQDLSALEVALIEKWGLRCNVVVLVGDVDQSIYSWRGATRDALLPNNAPPFHVLPKSYRVPSAIQERAMMIIGRASTRSGADYQPKDGSPGSVLSAGHSFNAPIGIVDHLEGEFLSDPFSGEAMVIASCSYMLSGITAELRQRGIGYHNPYTSEWNPLMRGGKDEVTGSDRIEAMARLETPRDWRIVLSGLRSERSGGPIRFKARELIGILANDSPPDKVAAILSEVMLPGGYALLDHAPSRNGASPEAVTTLIEASTEAVRRSTEYPLAVYRRDGLAGLRKPRVIVGTIHSVKGGEADTVYMSTRLSPAGVRQLMVPGWDGGDAIFRMFYVGATRAKENLILCDNQRTNGSRGVAL